MAYINFIPHPNFFDKTSVRHQRSMEELPPGFRFYPTEKELVSFYLHTKLAGQRPELGRVIPVVDIYMHEPWDLPRMAGERCRGETEQWFFFMAQQEREVRGGKPSRTTTSGYWKATGSPTYIFSSAKKKVIGAKKTMVFYKGRAPTGTKTKWKMNEYKAIDLASSTDAAHSPKLRQEMSVCRLYVTSGSSRAFDRRPPADQMQVASDDHVEGMEIRATDDSGGLKEEIAGCSSVDMLNMGGLEEPAMWEWDQLDWNALDDDDITF